MVVGLARRFEALRQPDYLFGRKLLNQFSSFSIYDSYYGPLSFAVQREAEFISVSRYRRLFQLFYGFNQLSSLSKLRLPLG